MVDDEFSDFATEEELDPDDEESPGNEDDDSDDDDDDDDDDDSDDGPPNYGYETAEENYEAAYDDVLKAIENA